MKRANLPNCIKCKTPDGVRGKYCDNCWNQIMGPTMKGVVEDLLESAKEERAE